VKTTTVSERPARRAKPLAEEVKLLLLLRLALQAGEGLARALGRHDCRADLPGLGGCSRCELRREAEGIAYVLENALAGADGLALARPGAELLGRVGRLVDEAARAGEGGASCV
jgi:hypothetical protein